MSIDLNKILLTDLDDVLWNLSPCWVDYLNNKYNLEVDINDIQWDMEKNFPSLTSDQIYSPLFQQNFWDAVKPREDAIEYIPKIQHQGFDVKVVTATCVETGRIKIPKLLNSFTTLKESDVILIKDKRLVRGKYLVDDNINNLQYREVPILMSQPHNKEFQQNFRVYSWRDIAWILDIYE